MDENSKINAAAFLYADRLLKKEVTTYNPNFGASYQSMKESKYPQCRCKNNIAAKVQFAR